MNKVLYFLAGVGVGAAGTYFYLKNKYEKYTQEEIDSVKEAYKISKSEAVSENSPGEEMVEVNDVKPDLKDLKKSMKEYKRKEVKDYTDYSTKVEKSENPIHQKFSEDPEIISEEDFGEIDGYETVTLMYYSDGVLAEDISDEIVDNAEEKVGTSYVDVLLKEGKDAVYVRNEITKTDYEICKSIQTYKEVTGNDPDLAETEE